MKVNDIRSRRRDITRTRRTRLRVAEGMGDWSGTTIMLAGGGGGG